MYFDDKSKKYVLLDIEGNSSKEANERKITQFAALCFQNGKIEEISWMNRNVNYINPYVQKLTRIHLVDLKNKGYSERNLIEHIYNLLKDADLIYAYGCDFDKNILKLMYKKYNLPPLKTKWIDIIDDVKKYLNPTKYK